MKESFYNLFNKVFNIKTKIFINLNYKIKLQL